MNKYSTFDFDLATSVEDANDPFLWASKQPHKARELLTLARHACIW